MSDLDDILTIYSIEEVDDERVNEDYTIDYDIEDDWPEYEIPSSDIVLNKNALLEIKLLLTEEKNIKAITQPPILYGDKDINNISLQGSDKYDEEFISTSPPHSINTIGQIKYKVTTSDDTMTMLLILCIIVWILFQLKKKQKKSTEIMSKEQELPVYIRSEKMVISEK